MNQNTRIRKYFIWLFWIAVWQTANILIHNNIIFVGPLDMVKALAEQAADPAFWATILNSFARISLGFLGAFFLSILLGSLAYLFPLVKELLDPVMLLIKSVPVASFVILALIWIGSRNLAVFTSFLVVVPMIYVSTLSGLEHTDRKLLEMARVFSMPLYKQVRYIYIPGLLPYLISGCRTALGMSWKSGAAAEVIGLPEHSIGEHLYMAKIYLETADLFAWTLVIILVSAVFEQMVLFLISRLCPQRGETTHETADL